MVMTMTDDEPTAKEALARLTGRPIEDFEYDGEIPDFADQEVKVKDD